MASYTHPVDLAHSYADMDETMDACIDWPSDTIDPDHNPLHIRASARTPEETEMFESMQRQTLDQLWTRVYA